MHSVKWDEKGLAVAIAQNVDTGAILMQGFVNKESLLKTIFSKKATFYSRSRSTLWTKGETSMNFINVSDVFLDCDRDSVSCMLDFAGLDIILIVSSHLLLIYQILITVSLIYQIIYLGKPDGPTCHTGAETCYYTSVDDIINDRQVTHIFQLIGLYYNLAELVQIC